MRSHGSRGGFGNKDHSHRRGGSFGTPTGGGGGPGHSHQQQNTSFRGRNQGHMRTGRQDAGSSLGARDGPMNSSFGNTGKKDENRRTFTDFKFVGLEFPDFHWSWGTLPVQETPPPSPVKTETDDAADALDAPRDNVKAEPTELDLSDARSGAEAAPHSSVKDENYTSASEAVSSRQLKAVPTELVIAPSSSDSPAGSFNTPPPSRLRIYFHTPVSLDDSRPIPNSLSTASVIGPAPSDSRKGKRKKLEDEECDQEEGRARPPPPQMGGAVGDDHSSVTPSVDVDEAERASIAPSAAESASEGDWLMAAIAADEAGGDADNQTDLGDNDVPHESEVPTSHDGGPCAAEKDGHEEPAGEWFDSAVNGIARVEDSSPAGGNAASCGIEPVHTADFGSIQGSHDPIVGLIAPADGSELPVASEVAVPDASEVGQVEGAPVSEVALAADASVTQVGDASSSDSGVPSAPLDDEHGSQTEKVADEVLPPVSEPSAAEIAPSEATAPELGPVAAGEVLSADLVEQVVVVGGAVENGSILPTVPGDAPEEPPSSSEDAVPVVKSETADIPIVNGHSTDSTPPREAAPSESGKQGEEDPLPVSSSSPVPKALLSATASVSGTTETSPVKKEPKEAKSASANRLSISYAGGNRRLVVDAEVIDTLTVFRSEGRIEVVMKVNKGEGTGFKGIYVSCIVLCAPLGR
jgi:20S proteasome subunit alpha 6